MWNCVKCGESHEMQFDTCWQCGTTRVGKEDPKRAAEYAKQKAMEADLATLNERAARIFLSTGPITEQFQVVDVVFAVDSQDQGMFAELAFMATGFHVGANPSKAFDKVKLQLKSQCLDLRGDAVINCQFEHRVAIANSPIPGRGGKQTVEIFAYGTVVKIK